MSMEVEIKDKHCYYCGEEVKEEMYYLLAGGGITHIDCYNKANAISAQTFGIVKWESDSGE